MATTRISYRLRSLSIFEMRSCSSPLEDEEGRDLSRCIENSNVIYPGIGESSTANLQRSRFKAHVLTIQGILFADVLTIQGILFADVLTIQGILLADVLTIQGILLADVLTIQGLTVC